MAKGNLSIVGLFLVFGLACSGISCKRQNQTTKVAHLAGNLVYDSPWQWVKVPKADLLKKWGSSANTKDSRYQRVLAATEAVWGAAMSIDSRISRLRIPMPQAILMEDSFANAWVDVTHLCVTNGPYTAKTTAVYSATRDRFFIPEINCYDSVVPFESLKFVDWFNKRGSACRITMNAHGGGFGFGKECNGAFDKASAIAIPVPEPALRFTTSLVALASPEELVYVAAHELGHYLRSHFINIGDHYNYFFKDDESARGKKPSPYAPFATKGRELFAIMEKTAPHHSAPTDSHAAVRKKQIVAEAAQLGLGVYTIEQEADEIAVEIMHKLGFNPRVAVEYQLKVLKFPSRVWEYSYEKCVELIKNKWTMSGKRVSLALEGIEDPHHNPCYRAWNMEQEISAHGWK